MGAPLRNEFVKRGGDALIFMYSRSANTRFYFLGMIIVNLRVADPFPLFAGEQNE